MNNCTKKYVWTDEMIERLHKYVEASRYYIVKVRENQVYGMDLPCHMHGQDWPAYLYYEEYDDSPPDVYDEIDDIDPTSIHVYLLKPVEWQLGDPNWSEADPETYETYRKATANGKPRKRN